MPTGLSNHMYVCVFVWFVCMSTGLSIICMYVCLSGLFVCLPVCQSYVCMCVCLVCLYVCLSNTKNVVKNWYRISPIVTPWAYRKETLFLGVY